MSVNTNKGLQIWMPMTKDLSNYGLNKCTISSSATYQATGGKIGGCYQCTSSNSINISNHGLAGMQNDRDFTLALWIKGIDDGWFLAATNFECGLRSNGLIFNMNDDQQMCHYNITTDNNTWYHYAFTWEAATKTWAFYVDGVQRGIGQYDGTHKAISSTLKLVYSGTRYINDLRIYSYALSENQIKEISRAKVGHWLGNDETIISNSDVPFAIEPGDRIAQLVFSKYERAEFVEVDELSETERGEGGFGHTGNK